jgi:hypothetical protein
MGHTMLDALTAINNTLLNHRWTDEDLERLVRPQFGVISSYEDALRDLAGIMSRDLGDAAPFPPDASTP